MIQTCKNCTRLLSSLSKLPGTSSRNHHPKDSFTPSDHPSREFDRLSSDQKVYLERIRQDYEEASALRLLRQSAASERYLGKFSPLYEAYKEYSSNLQLIGECREMLADVQMRDMALTEIKHLDGVLVECYSAIQGEILQSLQPSGGDIFIEIKMATGGAESAVFGHDLYKMYEKIAADRGYTWTVLEEDARGDAAVGRVLVSVSGGDDVMNTFQFEGGVHRVQRVPFNDTRIHTSTAVVIVLLRPEDITVELDPEDLDIVYTGARGPGGQHVNMTNSKCCMVHKPTGIRVTSQLTRSSVSNMKDCLLKLENILLKQEIEASASSRSKTEKQQAKQGDRADKIRTYNYKSGMITDHRYKVSVSGVVEYLEDPASFYSLHSKVSSSWQLQKLSEIASEISQ